MVTNINGAMINFATAVVLMDADICEQLNAELAPCTDQEFFAAYEAAHAAKYGAAWELSSANPCY